MNSLLSDLDKTALHKIADLVMNKTGNQVILKGEQFLSSKLSKRWHQLKLNTAAEYYNYLQTHFESELIEVISLLTIHHTYFFRESMHLDYLLDGALKRVADRARLEGRNKIRIWSAACSRGHEVYTIAAFLSFHLPRIAPGMDFEILGTDVDSHSVQFAKNGVYKIEEVKAVPKDMLEKNFGRGVGDLNGYVRVKNHLRSKVNFEVLNLLNIDKSKVSGQFDFIFCRNVLIYFSNNQISAVADSLLQYLNNYGLLFIGISETLMSTGLNLERVGPSIYSHKVNATTVDQSETKPQQKKLIRVFCVDDSPTILTLMQKVFRKEDGFIIVGTAKNGADAGLKTKAVQFDIMTLDLHMPELDGLGYIKKFYNEQHAPIIIVSSVSREEGELAQVALKLGASDYVEKPALNNIEERGEEIRTKAKALVRWGSQLPKPSAAKKSDEEWLSVSEKQVLTKQTLPLFILSDPNRMQTLGSLLKELCPVWRGAILIAPPLMSMTADFSKNSSYLKTTLQNDLYSQIEFCNIEELNRRLQSQGHNSTYVISLATKIESVLSKALFSLSRRTLFAEDNPGTSAELINLAKDVVPWTSFTYLIKREVTNEKAA